MVSVLLILIFSVFNVESGVLYILQHAVDSKELSIEISYWFPLKIIQWPSASLFCPGIQSSLQARKDKEYIQAYSSDIKSLHLSYCELVSLVLVLNVIFEVSKMIMI